MKSFPSRSLSFLAFATTRERIVVFFFMRDLPCVTKTDRFCQIQDLMGSSTVSYKNYRIFFGTRIASHGTACGASRRRMKHLICVTHAPFRSKAFRLAGAKFAGTPIPPLGRGAGYLRRKNVSRGMRFRVRTAGTARRFPAACVLRDR